MSRILITLLVFTISLCACCKNRYTTLFMGIPVDGSKRMVINKIKKKNFKSVSLGDTKALTGIFNGTEVYISFAENRNNEVYRIIISDKTSTTAERIRERFNKLYQQFTNNSKYLATSNYELIPEDEDIAEKMKNGKEYSAVFLQNTTEGEKCTIWNELRNEAVKRTNKLYQAEQNYISADAKKILVSKIEADVQNTFDKTISTNLTNRRVCFTIIPILQEKENNKESTDISINNDISINIGAVASKQPEKQNEYLYKIVMYYENGKNIDDFSDDL